MHKSLISGDNPIKPHISDTRKVNHETERTGDDISLDPKDIREMILSATNFRDLNEIIRLIEHSNMELTGDNNGTKTYEMSFYGEMHYTFTINESDHSLTMLEESTAESNRAGSTSINLRISNSQFTVESTNTNSEGQISSYEIRNPEGRQVSIYEDGSLHLQRFHDHSNNMQNILLFADGEDQPPVGNYHYELENNESVNTPEEYIQYLAQRLDSYDKLADFIQHFMKYTFDEKDYWQPATETVERIGFAQMLGDCDDWAILARDILRLQGVNAHTVLVPGHATCFWLEQDEEGNYNAYTLGTTGFKRNGQSVDYNKTGSSEITYTDPMEATNSALSSFATSPSGESTSFLDEIAAESYAIGIEGEMDRLNVNLEVFTEAIYYDYFMAQYEDDVEQQREILEQIIENNPSTRYLRDLAVVYLRLDDRQSFNTLFEHYMENEQNPDQITNFVLNLMKNGQIEVGTQLIASLIADEQAQPLLYVTYAIYCEDESRAREALETAIDRYPDDQLIILANLQQEQLLPDIRRDPGKLPIILESNGLLTSEQYMLLKFNRGSREIDIPG